MKKIYKLREWLTVAEAAEQLSLMLSEPVNEADLLRLALDGHLTLSVNLVNHARARLGRVLPYKDVPHHEALFIRSEEAPDQPVWIPEGECLQQVGEITEETPYLCLEKAVVSIEGVWDLTMMGVEQLDVEHAFQQLTGGPDIKLIKLAGPILSRPDGRWAQLQDKLPGGTIDLPSGKRREIAASTYPAAGLPTDAHLVMKTSVLAEFHAKLLAPSVTPAADGARLGTRERETLLKILIGMALGGYGYVPAAARSSTSRDIASDVEKTGLSVSDDTIRKYLKEAEVTVLSKPGKS